jgi:hypothetical protein
MPDVPIKPINKRIEELITKITQEMWRFFKVKEMPKVKENKVITYLIKKIAELEERIEKLER